MLVSAYHGTFWYVRELRIQIDASDARIISCKPFDWRFSYRSMRSLLSYLPLCYVTSRHRVLTNNHLRLSKDKDAFATSVALKSTLHGVDKLLLFGTNVPVHWLHGCVMEFPLTSKV